MAEQTPHSLEACTFSGSLMQIVYDRDTRRLLTISPVAAECIKPQNLQNAATETESAMDAELIGKPIDELIQVDDNRQGIIAPTEITDNEGNNSKWVFSCMHQSTIDGQDIEIRFIEDPSVLKSFYNSASRNPVAVDQIKKVSTSVPDFVLDGNFKVSEVTAVKLGRDNRVKGVFPYNSFLGLALEDLWRSNLLSYIHEEDHITLLQTLAESFTKGSGNAIVRFIPHQFSVPIWVQLQSIKETNSEDSNLICAILQLKDGTQTEGYFSNAFSLISSKSAQVLAATQQFSFQNSIPSFNSFMSRPVIDKLKDAEDPKMYIIFDFSLRSEDITAEPEN